MYRVIRYFTDLQDNNHAYNVGDTFPHKGCGYAVSEQRFAELAGKNNLQKRPLIKFVEDKPKKKRAKKSAAE